MAWHGRLYLCEPFRLVLSIIDMNRGNNVGCAIKCGQVFLKKNRGRGQEVKLQPLLGIRGLASNGLEAKT